MIISYTNKRGLITTIINTEDIRYISALNNKMKIVYKDMNQINIETESWEEIQSILDQYSKIMDAKSISIEVTETDNLEKIL